MTKSKPTDWQSVFATFAHLYKDKDAVLVIHPNGKGKLNVRNGKVREATFDGTDEAIQTLKGWIR